MTDSSIIKRKNSCNPKIGDRYNRLVLLSFDERRGSQQRWLCRCDCGTERIFILDLLRREHTRSCGCLQREETSKRSRTHGEGSKNTTVEYRCWLNMRNRCYYKPHKDYKDYGGRGIIVCPEWRYSYETFLKDMGRKPSSKYSIERKDSDGNYTPENCIWTTLDVQAKNKRRAIFVMFNGEKRYLKDVCKERNVSYHMVHGRIKTLRWDLERALSQASQRKLK